MKKIYALSALILAALLGGSGALWAQQDEPEEMPQHCRQMMEHHQQMQQRATQMDQELETLVQRMNAAQGEAKVEATAAVVSELVEQRKAIGHGMMEMCSGMMGHMGDEAGEQSGMMSCPMMKGMMGMEGMEGMEGMHGMQHGDEGGSR